MYNCTNFFNWAPSKNGLKYRSICAMYQLERNWYLARTLVRKKCSQKLLAILAKKVTIEGMPPTGVAAGASSLPILFFFFNFFPLNHWVYTGFYFFYFKIWKKLWTVFSLFVCRLGEEFILLPWTLGFYKSCALTLVAQRFWCGMLLRNMFGNITNVVGWVGGTQNTNLPKTNSG